MNALLVDKIFENIKKYDIHDGCLIASVSKNNPDYYYHWIRDAALVMKTLVREYKNTNDLRIFKQMVDYIKVESHFQKLNTISGIGEPKFNVNLTPYNESWGRPQNDGPALRGLVMLEMLEIFEDYYFVVDQINSILLKDLTYVIENINKPCFDLWEEIYGYHLYTRGVQYKFLKELENKNIFPELNYQIQNKRTQLWELIQHHKIINTSYDVEGVKCREYDTSLLLLVSHIDYDMEIVDITQPHFLKYVKEMVKYFQKEYILNNCFENKMILLGRYQDDTYFNGNPWIICTCAFYQLIIKLQDIGIKIPEFDYQIYHFQNYIKKFTNLNIPEQVDKFSGNNKSALRLTWNYSELIVLENMFQKILQKT